MALMLLVVGETRDGVVLLVALVPVIGVDVFLEACSRRALKRLAAATAPRARVIRDGAEVALELAHHEHVERRGEPLGHLATGTPPRGNPSTTTSSSAYEARTVASACPAALRSRKSVSMCTSRRRAASSLRSPRSS